MPVRGPRRVATLVATAGLALAAAIAPAAHADTVRPAPPAPAGHPAHAVSPATMAAVAVKVRAQWAAGPPVITLPNGRTLTKGPMTGGVTPHATRDWQVYTNWGDGLNLDILNNSTNNGTPVIQWPADGGPNQQWLGYEDLIDEQIYGIPVYRFLNHTGFNKCLDLRGGSGDVGAPVQLWDCNGGENQNWGWMATGYYAYGYQAHLWVNLASGKCIAVHNASYDPGATLVQDWCTAAWYEAFF